MCWSKLFAATCSSPSKCFMINIWPTHSWNDFHLVGVQSLYRTCGFNYSPSFSALTKCLSNFKMMDANVSLFRLSFLQTKLSLAFPFYRTMRDDYPARHTLLFYPSHFLWHLHTLNYVRYGIYIVIMQKGLSHEKTIYICQLVQHLPGMSLSVLKVDHGPTSLASPGSLDIQKIILLPILLNQERCTYLNLRMTGLQYWIFWLDTRVDIS